MKDLFQKLRRRKRLKHSNQTLTLSLFEEELVRIDKRMASTQSSEIPDLFSRIPLDIFGRLLLNVPPQYPNIKAFFPSMAPDEVQQSWTGAHGEVLLRQSVAFLKSLLAGYSAAAGTSLQGASILDFGCGWGRLVRLLYKVTPIDHIYAVDPWDQSLEHCRAQGLKGHLARSEWVPKTLPFDRQFDLIFALSVFTHLSERTALIAFETLRRHLAGTGVLAITIRPKEYWHHHDGGRLAAEMIARHDAVGFAFAPHHRTPIEGDITFGDTSVSLEYLASRLSQWKIASLDYNSVDPYQLIVFLRPV